MLQQPQRKRLYEDIVNQIISLINEGKLKPGDRLPSERELASELKISRNSVREAFRTLELRGNVEIRPGDGVFVKKIDFDKILTPFSEIISGDAKLVLDLLEARDVIEVEIARLAALYGTKEEIKEIKEILEEAEKEIPKGSDGIEYDNEFHMAIARATHNSVYIIIINLIKDSLIKSKKMTESVEGQPIRTIADHWEIYDAIAEGNAEKAGKMMRNHLNKTKKNIIKIIGRQD
ncbi:FadR/GntR family transcriptional regulator [Maledivibacter halophilus]|uniref:GntR family transcriptional regulator, transcriptional repressor for pyruvate dehydrogenase complex n=1 Tax=Maledivibacter halophilus TaxID=36842 RepID=A0A1T5MEB3_9FIRM|nr:FadR/GntR family transcriptional regulator [Maledivibacter halophilus]SKC86552.1 GntR family transcriptional regulator, transcriptional repressor for pyruvate dehydrogenase complex [Maledivibacter halophilus]